MAKFYGLRGTWLSIAIGVIAGLDFLLFGYDQGVTGGLLTLPSFTSVFPEINTHGMTSGHASTIQGITVASYNLGCFAGAVICIWIGDMLGRRRTIFLGSAIMVVGAAIQCSSYSLGQLVAGRVITGVGNGLNTSTVPTWQSETSKSHKRGQMVMIEGALITGGIMISYWIDFGLSYAQSSVSWRFPIAFQIFFALIILIFILPLPESPRWLILKGREDEALTVLAALSDLPPEDTFVQNEFTAIKETVLEQAQGGFRDVFTMGPDRNFHRAALAYVNQMFQQISGINLITYYAEIIFGQIGLDPFVSRIVAACNGTEYFMASWIAVFTVEKIGRRPLMLFGAVGMSLSMVVLAATTSQLPSNKAAGFVAAVFLFVFNSFFAVGWLGMTWLYPSEIVPLKIRAPANALSTSANWIFNFMVVMITPVAFNSIGYRTYIIFAAINAFIVPVVYFFFPETAYRSLEEMDDIFRRSSSVFDVVSIARSKNTPHRYDKNGNLLISYLDSDLHAQRSASLAMAGAGVPLNDAALEKDHLKRSVVQNTERSSHNEGYRLEGGYATGDGSSQEGSEKI